MVRTVLNFNGSHLVPVQVTDILELMRMELNGVINIHKL